jgi:hypothetical protein
MTAGNNYTMRKTKQVRNRIKRGFNEFLFTFGELLYSVKAKS